jgi:flagellar assembly factor FliW
MEDVIRIETARFGELEVPNSSVMHFPDGIVPFGRDLTFAVIGDDCSGLVPQPGPVAWLQCVQLPELAFWVGHAGLLLPDHRIELEPHHLRRMHIRRPDQLSVLLILTLQDRQVTANLLAPVLLNTARRLGRQVILTGGMDLVRTPVPAERLLGQPA